MQRLKRSTFVITASLAIHGMLIWGGSVALRAQDCPSAPIVYAVDLSQNTENTVESRIVLAASRHLRPRLGERLPPWARGPADTLRQAPTRGTETGHARPRPRERTTVGPDLDDLRYRVYDHPSQDTPQRIRTAPQAVTHDNRRATPTPAMSQHLVTGRGDSDRRSNWRADHSARGPQAKRGAQPKVVGGATAPRLDGDRAVHLGAKVSPRRVERTSRLPAVGATAPAQRRPRVPRDPAASETRHRGFDVADARNRKEASSARRQDLLAMAQASGAGHHRGRGRGNQAGRRGSTEGARRGATIWLNSRDRRYVTYLHKIHAKIQPLWRFPKRLEILFEQGDVLVEFVLRADGTLARAGVRRGSGYHAFDANALAAVRRAAPFPAVPATLGTPLTILAPFEFANPLIR
ncbi:MAG: TonB family protein [Deltaproteobacteria bacterium]|nr:TonB family protein [Deltaproteobacteria bacterium]